MNNLICRLGSSFSEESMYYIDGARNFCASSAEIKQAASLMAGKGGISLSKHKDGDLTSGPFSIRFYKNFFIISGSGGSSTNVSDRHTYFFITKSCNLSKIIPLYQEYTKEIDVIPELEDIQSIKKTFSIIKVSILILCLIAIICLVLFM